MRWSWNASHDPFTLALRVTLSIWSLAGLTGCQHVETASFSPEGPGQWLVVADFDRAGWRTNLGDAFGNWDHDPGDQTQFCRVRLVEDPRIGTTGYSVMLEYDVDSPNPAFNGFWMKLPSLPVREFQALAFAIKGDPERGFTRRLKVELKSPRHAASYVLEGIQPTWTQMRVPLRAFHGIEKVREATEFVIVFDDQTVTEPVGAIYLDQVRFESLP